MMKPPQTENERLDIHDHDRSTEGGPPGWMAFSAVFLFYIPAAIVVLLIVVLISMYW